MDVTDKQARVGVSGPGPTGGNAAQPGPDATRDVRAAQASAERAGNARATADHLATPRPDQGARMWDEGLAVSDVEGGGSA